ncbi:hypothetical protein JAAARDRAFT_77851 [Jaapia argillacea MUCL 33604]|uniref:GDP/GTP exchange factor Sec2 N-terminal domain-containing protein n=1 Tax=Jaapia argillacea MUCL 33604 TaxID=933084 RepID=A0A067QBL2_9AGAM|nr:hypothetical protein JAAARDRAFT_77851 [Jaapia argillacea MUCL 33604]
MLHFPQSPQPPQPKRSSTSFNPKSSPLFISIDDDLRDARRVISHGQEDDLRTALSRMVSRVEELANLLKESYTQTSDLQTELTLAKSNLQLSLANNEMLEDALKRDSGGKGRDVGWRRLSAQEREREREHHKRITEEERESRRSEDTGSNSQLGSPVLPSPTPTPPPQDTRFFRFRFGSSANASNSRAPSPSLNASTPNLTRSQSHAGPPLSAPTMAPTATAIPNSTRPHPLAASHLTSASLPSLIPDPSDPSPAPPPISHQEFTDLKNKFDEVTNQLAQVNKHLESVKKEVEGERKERVRVCDEKGRLEEELESLSQALFEEANKMVSTERIHRHETEEELKQALAEKEALKGALKVLEVELSGLQASSNSRATVAGTRSSDRGDGVVQGRSRSSSAVGIKSRRSSRSSGSGSVSSIVFVGGDSGLRSEDEAGIPSKQNISPSLATSTTPDTISPTPPPSISSDSPSYPFAQEVYVAEEGPDPWADATSQSPIVGRGSIASFAPQQEGPIAL